MLVALPLQAQMRGGRPVVMGRPSFVPRVSGFGTPTPRFGSFGNFGGFAPRFNGGFVPRFGGFCGGRFCGFFPHNRFFFGFSTPVIIPWYGFYGAYAYPWWYGAYSYPAYSYPVVSYSSGRYDSDLDYPDQQKRAMEELSSSHDLVVINKAEIVSQQPRYNASAPHWRFCNSDARRHSKQLNCFGRHGELQRTSSSRRRHSGICA